MRYLAMLSVAGVVLVTGCDNTTDPTQPSDISAATTSSTPKSYSGRGTGLEAFLPIGTFRWGDTGPLPSSGGAKSVSHRTISIPGILTAKFLNGTTDGKGSRSLTTSSLTELKVTLGLNTIQIAVLRSFAEASCGTGRLTTNGNSQIVRAVINGRKYDIGTTPNFTIPLIGGKIVFNERLTPPNGLTVKAMDIIVTGVGQIIVARSHADVVC